MTISSRLLAVHVILSMNSSRCPSKYFLINGLKFSVKYNHATMIMANKDYHNHFKEPC